MSPAPPSVDRSRKREPGSRLPLLARRAVGGLLVLLAMLPVYRLLSGPAGGFPAWETVRAADRYYVTLWQGSALLILAAILLAFVFRGRAVRRLARIGELLAVSPSAAFAAGLAVVSGLLTLWFGLRVLHGEPLLHDTQIQLLHARYLAAGKLAGPPLAQPEFWNMQFMLNTPQGWVSQYPPLQAAILAVGFLVGAVWAVGPLQMAVTAFFTCLAAERLLPEKPAVARLGALLVAVSPFLIALAGASMNHATAAALAATAAYCALRALDGEGWWGWAMGAGAAVGGMLATRPLSAVVIGAAVTLGVWLWVPKQGARQRRQVGVRLAAMVVGALPFAVALGFYNAHFFGSPTRFGYLAAAGPPHGLGFHPDPWGNLYGPMEALGYTSADLLALGRDLLGTPLPVVAVVGLFLIVAPRLTGGERVLAAWALAPALANAFYWHHDLVLGPRMLGEAAPAWCVLAAVAGVGLVRRAPSPHRPDGAVWYRRALAGLFVLALLLGLGYLGPRRLLGFGERVGAEPVVQPPATSRPSLVFVHEGWEDRLGARLAARGLRLDSVRTILGRYSRCQVQRALDGTPGDWESECRRQAASDRYGVLGIPALVWQGDLPGLRPAGPMWVRDLGPDHNVRLMEQFPDRVALVLLPPIGERTWVLVAFEQGMSVLWGTERSMN